MSGAERVTLSEGSGGKEMHELVTAIASRLPIGAWEHIGDDAASLLLDRKRLFLTTDSYVVIALQVP